MSSILKKGMTILFQGDSITDCGRRNDSCGIGHGYVHMVSAWLWARYPELDLKIENRGIAGDRVKDLAARWENDCLAIKPDLLSVMVGINEGLRRYDRGDPTPVETYTETYRSILQQARETCDPMIALCEPSFLDHPARGPVREDLNPKIEAVRGLAREFGAIHVPLDGVFAAASARRERDYWLPDGVHPTIAGHGLIAQTWLRHVLGIEACRVA